MFRVLPGSPSLSGIIYGLRRITLVPDHGAQVTPLGDHEPWPWIRVRQGPFAPPPPAMLAGRDREVDEALAAVGSGRPVEFHAPYGFGVSTLLRQLADRLDRDGLVAPYLRAGHDPAEDLLQRLFERLYATSEPLKPTADQILTMLEQTDPVLVLDEVLLDVAELGRFLDELPSATVLLGTPRPLLERLGRDGRSHRLGGLDGEAALQIVRDVQGRAPDGTERTTALELARDLDGRPLHIELAAGLARRQEGALTELAEELDGAEAVERASIAALEAPERSALAALVLAGGAPLPAAAVAAMTGLDTVGTQLAALRGERLAVEEDGDRFLMPVRPSPPYRELLNELDVAAAARGLAGWLAELPPTGWEARAAVRAAVNVLGIAAERGRWEAVLTLTGPVESVLLLTGRWAGCRRVLWQGLAVARTAGERRAEARCRHQLGVLAACLGETEHARNHLEQALALRRRLGETEAAALTLDALRLVAPVPPAPAGDTGVPVPAPPSRPARPVERERERPRPAVVPAARRWLRTRWALLALALVLVLVPLAINGVTAGRSTGTSRSSAPTTAAPTTVPPVEGWALEPETLEFPPTQPGFVSQGEILSVRRTGSQPASIGTIELSGDTGDFEVSRECQGVVTDPGSRCRVLVRFTPSTPGAKRVNVTIGLEDQAGTLTAQVVGTAANPG